MKTRPGTVLVFVLSTLVPGVAAATDTVRELKPGITYLERVTTGTRPQRIFAVGVDLSRPNIGLHASADARYAEWDVNTLVFADNVDAVAAINADWSCIPQGSCGDNFHRPVGLALSGGMKWNSHIGDETVGATWGYLGCTLGKQCNIGWPRALNHPEMVFSPLHNPSVAPLRFQNAVGGNGLVLVDNGVAATGCFDSGTDTPRSAVCMQADGIHMWMVVVDGRGTGDGDTGMTCDETRQLLLGAPFLCHDALMLDGGGSSTLVIEDTDGTACRGGRCIKNRPSDGAARTVGNHLGIIYSETVDPRCAEPNGRWCDGTVISTCEGGRFMGSGDCGVYGAGCQEDGAYAFCVHPFCPGGDGLQSTACVDGTRIASCNDGQYGEGDCGVFGLVCGGASGTARCMDPRCAAGPDGSYCTAAGLRATCSAGAYTEEACAGDAACTGGACTAPAPDAGAPPDDGGSVSAPDAGGAASADAGGTALLDAGGGASSDAGVAAASDAGGVALVDAGAPAMDAGDVPVADGGLGQGGSTNDGEDGGDAAAGCTTTTPTTLLPWMALALRRRRAPR